MKASERPDFVQIVSRLEEEIGDEIKRKDEPEITVYSQEPDQIYHDRVGVDEEFEDSEGEDDTAARRAKLSTERKVHETELQKVLGELEEVEERRKTERREFEAVIAKLTTAQKNR